MNSIDLEQIRSQNPIETIVGEKFRLKKSGNHFIGVEHDSLVINPRTGWYHWNSRDEHGDVFDFVGRHLLPGGMSWNSRDPASFMEAVRFLARRAGISLEATAELQQSPAWIERQLTERLHQALLDNPQAVAYVNRMRGWTMETVRAERVGYIPPDKRGLLDGLKLSDSWQQIIDRFPVDMIVYVHRDRGRLTYLSGRSVTGKKHYNPPRDLIGERQPYGNHHYRPGAEEIVIVEGQADAITFGQWGIAAVALAGMHASAELIAQLRTHRRVYVALDNTPEARATSLDLARKIGAMACLPRLPDAVKDANEWLVKQQPTTKQVLAVLNDAQTLLESEVAAIQHMFGLQRQDAIDSLIERAATWSRTDVARLKFLMKDKLDVSASFFNDIFKVAQEQQTQEDQVSDQPQILSDDIPLLSPALGFMPDLALVTVSIMERTSQNRLNIQPYLVTSKRELRRLGEEQIVQINGHEAALRVIPEGTEFFMRWRYRDIQRFLEGESSEPGSVFNTVHDLFTHYVDFSSPVDGHIVALWVIGTYFYTMFPAYPYLALNGPKNSGKSTVLTVAKPLAFNMVTTSDVTGPSLFRLIHHNSCTVGIDEAERYHNPRDPEMQQIRQLLNSGYKPGMPAIRLMGDDMKPHAFDVYSPKMLANIAGLEDILASRCIPIPMRRADRKMPCFSPSYDGATIRHQLYSLALTYYLTIQTNYFRRPELHKLNNRSNELWSPLVALAAFFEEQGAVAGLLDSIEQAAARDNRLSEGKALSDQEEAVLQALELMTRRGGEEGWIKAVDLREQVAVLLSYPAEKMGPAQWIGHVLKRLQLTDRSRRKAHAGGQMYAIVRSEVLDMMTRYDVAIIDNKTDHD